MKKLISLLFLQFCLYAHAENTQQQDLQFKLLQRDQVILELLDRVESLEKQLGVEPARSKPDTSPVSEDDGKDNTKIESRPGVVVADELAAERALERSLTMNGALLLPKGVIEIEPSLRYARQEDTTPGFVTTMSGVIASETERNSDSLTAGLTLRFGLPADSQLEIGLPYRWRRTETITNVGFSPVSSSRQYGHGRGDVRLALATTLLREDVGQPDLIGRISWNSDSGEISDNGVALGGGFQEIQGSLSFIKREDPVVFTGGLSYEHTREKDMVQPGDTYAFNLGSYIALSPQTSINFVLSMAYQAETRLAGEKLPGSDRTLGTLFVGGSTLVSRGTLLNISLGVGLTDDADDLSLLISLPIRI